MNIYKRLAAYLKPYMSRLIGGLACMVGIGLLTSFLMYMIKPVMNKIFAEHQVSMIIPIGTAIIVAAFLKGILSYIQAYIMSYIGQRVVLDIRNELYSHISFLSMDFYKKESTGKLMSRITNDISLIQFAMTNVPANLVRDGVTLICLTGLAFYLNWKLAFISIFVFPIAMLPIVKFGKKLRHVSDNSQTQMGHLYNVLHETITGIKIVKAFLLEEHRKKIFAESNRSYFNIIMRSMRVMAMTSPIMEFIGSVGIAVIIIIGGYQVARGHLTQGDFFAFIGAIVSLYNPVKSLSSLNNTIQQGISASQRVFEILDTKPSIQEKPNAVSLSRLEEKISFEDVSFSYGDAQTILHDISFEIKKGELVALVGPSGAGKSTIVNLIPRFYDPQKGNIFIDEKNIGDVTLKSLIGQIGMVSQDTVLFNDTIENNIKSGKLDATHDEVVAAAKAANANDFILGFAQGYDTIVGEHGARLSGGERQRIAIARAILKDPQILILDEATSALDSESEKLVQDAIEHLIANRTTIVIAHRLSTVRNAHKILVLQDGRIVEQGTHADLLNQAGLYAKLYSMQFRD